MGSFLDKPETSKTTECGQGEINNEKIGYGVSCMQGWRVHMEDTHVHEIGLDGFPNLSIFGVFDGHGGRMVSEYIEANLVKEFLGNEKFQSLKGKSCAGAADANVLGETVQQVFLSLDAKMQNLDAVKNKEDHSGSTAVIAFVTPTHIVVGNCGDSRLIICGEDSVKFSSMDHKPTLPSEQARIEKAGGTVTFRRVNGDLAVSRALGDFVYKANESLPAVEQQVSAEPEISLYERKPNDQFVLVACDGIWDVMCNEAVCEYVLSKMNQGHPIDVISEELIDTCLDKGSRDNMSVVLVSLPGVPSKVGTLTREDIYSSRADNEDSTKTSP
mmetsp:Transcript_12820/g.20733  ORF Transcript_12820/g.20733 Transcript_12820/m.20733 type:complete len:329 (+) Transcript_12820:184-1170(+)|eukprot:CAMPEP_0203747912 /NCGR_PEP_ID=MMETSP0098-20131031/2927_1 /ASSEMBLY_ACC=CAM_ASM_000208 /TAXON_ID=96639 /ORGANISM=" , Strain NY0313808BC1" /LENGTH=328 /DNA_ID=CAMNT_0050636489 /DNA_START=182 /DNA_END=1168 /DNA_ORIENTATION=-